MRIDEDGGHGGRGQSLLSLGEALSEPAPAGPSRLAQAIAQVRAEKGIAPPREAVQPMPHNEQPATAAPRISPLLEALAAEPQAPERPLPPPVEDWPRERSTGEVPPLLAAASQWPEKRPARQVAKVEAEPLPEAEETEPEPFDDTPPASPIAAAVAAVKAVHAAKETRAEAETQAAAGSAPPPQSRQKPSLPELEPFPMAQPGDAFWDDAARVLGLDGGPAHAGASRPRALATPAGQGRAGASASAAFSAGSVISALRGSLRLIMATTVAGTLLGGGVALLTPRTYSSTAELLADGRGVAADTSAPQPAIPDEALRVMVENQLRVLRSQSLLADVADRLKLADDPEFDGTAEGMSLSALAQIISGGSSNTDPERRKLIAAQALARSLAITRDGASFVIDITATTRDPDKSALIANTLAETFLANGGQAGAKGAVRVLVDPPSSEAAPAEAPQATRIMSRAMPALASNPPSRLSIIFKGLALGLLAGLGLAVLQMLRRRFAATETQEEAAPLVAARQVVPATLPAARPSAARPEATKPRAATVPSRAEADDRMSNPQESVAHPAPEEDRPMQRSPYRRSHESYPATSAGPGSYQDRHQPSPYRQAPMRPAAYAPQPGPSAYPQDAGDPRRAARSAEPYWQQPMPAAPPPHPGQQQMLHPHQYPMQPRPQAYAPMPPQPQGYAPVPGYGPYGEPAPAYGAYSEPAPGYGQGPSAPGVRDPRYADRGPSAYGPEPTGRGPYDPRYGDRDASAYGPESMGIAARDPRYGGQPRSPYGAEPMGPHDPRHGRQPASAYGPGPMGMGDPRYGDHAPHAYASQEPQNWQAHPRETDQSIEEIRATLRECREAIRDLGDKRTRRRYF